MFHSDSKPHPGLILHLKKNPLSHKSKHKQSQCCIHRVSTLRLNYRVQLLSINQLFYKKEKKQTTGGQIFFFFKDIYFKSFAEMAAFKQSFHSPLGSNMPPFICLMTAAAAFCEAMTDGYLRRISLETTFSEKFSWMLFLRTYQHLSIRHKPLLRVALYQIAECGCSAGGCHMFKEKNKWLQTRHVTLKHQCCYFALL